MSKPLRESAFDQGANAVGRPAPAHLEAPPLDRKVQGQIARRLAVMMDCRPEQDCPAQFAELLQRIEKTLS